MILSRCPGTRIGAVPGSATIAVVTAVATVVSAGCGGDNTTSTPLTSPVIATTSIWADVMSEVMCGVPVASIIPPGADPHTFEPSLRDRRAIDDAALLVANGAGLDDTLTDLAGPTTDVVGIATLLGAAVSESGGTDDEHGNDVDPHFWQDPMLVVDALDGLGDAVTEAGYDDCSAEYAAELRALDREIAALIDALPTTRRVMVTSHDALGYFADRYGLEIVGTVIPAANTLAETNAADLAALSEIIERRGVGVIFTEELESSSDAEALARRLGVDVVPLVTDALTDDPATDSYVEMMRTNAETIAAALSP